MPAENIGGIAISITGDASPLYATLAAAQGAASSAGRTIASNLTSGMGPALAGASGLIDQFGRSIQSSIITPVAAATPVVEQLTDTTRKLATESSHAVTEIQAVSGTIRTLDGNQGIRAAERFLTLIPGLGKALQGFFPIVGAIAFIEVVARAVGKFTELSDAEKKATEESKAFDAQIQNIKRDVEQIDLRKFGVIFGQGAAAAKSAADAAIEAESNVIKVGEKTYILSQLRLAVDEKRAKLAGIKQLQQNPATFEAGINLEKNATEELTAAQRELTEALNQQFKLREEAKLKSTEVLFGSGDNAQKRLDADAELSRKQEEINRKALEAWEYQKRQFEEQQKAIERYQEALNRAAQQLHDTIERVAVSNRELADKFAAAADKYAEGRGKLEAEAAKKQFEPAPNIAQIPISPQGENALAGPLAATIAQLAAAGYKTVNQQESAINGEERLLSLMGEVNTPLGQQVALREKILEAQIALSESEGKSADSQIRALTNLKAQVTLLQWQKQGLATIYSQITGQALRIPGALGGALAGGLLGGQKGENVGKQVTDALRNIGKDILGGVFTQVIQRLIAELIVHLSGITIQTVSQNIQTTAITANTAALIANTAALTGVAAASAAGGAAGSAGGIGSLLKGFLGLFGFAAAGGPISGPTIVGERGPEIFIPHNSGTVIPNHMIGHAADGAGLSSLRVGGGSVSIGEMHFHAHGVTSPTAFMRHVAKELPNYLKSTGPGYSPASS